MAQKDNLLIIAPTKMMARMVCVDIFGINPNEYAYSAESAINALIGNHRPTVIFYCRYQRDIWKDSDLEKLDMMLQPCDAIILDLPEVARIERMKKEKGH